MLANIYKHLFTVEMHSSTSLYEKNLVFRGHCTQKYLLAFTFIIQLAALAQMVACLPLVQQVRGSIPGRIINFNLKIFNLGVRRMEMYTF